MTQTWKNIVAANPDHSRSTSAVGAAFGISWLPDLPDPVAIHWGSEGADGYGSAWTLILIPLGIIKRAMHLARRMVHGRVDGVQAHRFAAGVDDVVPHAGGDLDRPVVGDVLLEVQLVLRGAHHAAALARLDAQELIVVRVHLQPDRLSDPSERMGP